MRRTCTLVLCICIIVSVLSPVSLAYNAQNTENMLVDGYVTAREFREAQSVMTYQGIVDEIDPESCGGVFLDENGTLNIWVVPSYTSRVKGNVDRAKEMTSDKLFNENVPFSVVYRTTSRSIAAMKRVSDELMAQSKSLGIISTRIDEMNNVLAIGVEDGGYDIERIEKYCLPLDNGYLIEPGSDFEPIVSVKNGGEVYSSSGAFFSIACGAIVASNARCFLSAAHCGLLGDKVYDKDSGALIGKINLRYADYSRGQDFMIIERADSSVLPSKYFSDGEQIDYLPGSVPVNASVKGYGANGIYSGTVLTTSNNFGGYVDFIETDFYAEHGDSGGALVYKLYTGGGVYVNYVVGIMSARNANPYRTASAKTTVLNSLISIGKWVQ